MEYQEKIDYILKSLDLNGDEQIRDTAQSIKTEVGPDLASALFRLCQKVESLESRLAALEK
ncbi:MAG: hypothetical protein HOH16_00040 [Planctomycetaceae bacterium]|jgi:hypothetical protein|nr:hypothetical protein [Planctomycetaceae bacterium]